VAVGTFTRTGKILTVEVSLRLMPGESKVSGPAHWEVPIVEIFMANHWTASLMMLQERNLTLLSPGEKVCSNAIL
jgi:hypothetical protein